MLMRWLACSNDVALKSKLTALRHGDVVRTTGKEKEGYVKDVGGFEQQQAPMAPSQGMPM